ncbi:MAG: type II secretion system F family protein [Nanoarchaeota archaeon]|nr:type II secretion system F family protein [Nanoarchaeota archaeon]
MEFKRMHWFGIIAAAVLIAVDIIYYVIRKDANLLLFLLGISAMILFLPFIIGIVLENKKEQEITEMFLEFSRNLAESVATGTPISKSIINIKKKNYGELTPHIEKLANQISLGIPVGRALETFASDVGSNVVNRAVALIREAERAGGEIDYILESVAKSISEVDKLKKERKAAIYSLVVQGYIIFFIFIGIMLIMQFHILPLAASAGTFGKFTVGDLTSSLPDSANKQEGLDVQSLSRPFLALLVAQGLLAGFTIGKLAEGSIKAGMKHSFILAITAFLVSTGANLFLAT